MKTETLDNELFWKLEQSWHYERIVAINGVVLKCKIVRNAYNPQSSLNVHAFDSNSLEWKQSLHRPISECACRKYAYTDKETPEMLSSFRQDALKAFDFVQMLIQIAKKGRSDDQIIK